MVKTNFSCRKDKLLRNCHQDHLNFITHLWSYFRTKILSNPNHISLLIWHCIIFPVLKRFDLKIITHFSKTFFSKSKNLCYSLSQWHIFPVRFLWILETEGITHTLKTMRMHFFMVYFIFSGLFIWCLMAAHFFLLPWLLWCHLRNYLQASYVQLWHLVLTRARLVLLPTLTVLHGI